MGSSGVSLAIFIRHPLVRAARFPLLLSCLASALNSVFPGPLGMLFLATAALTLLVWWLIGMIKFGGDLFCKRWLKGTGRVLVAAASAPVVAIGILSGYYIHLFTLYPYYLYRIEHTQGRPVAFDWGDGAVTVLDGMGFFLPCYTTIAARRRRWLAATGGVRRESISGSEPGAL
jgi:hypothetical protein